MENHPLSTLEQNIREQLEQEYGFASISFVEILPLTHTTAQLQVIIAKGNGFIICLYCRVTYSNEHWSINTEVRDNSSKEPGG